MAKELGVLEESGEQGQTSFKEPGKWMRSRGFNKAFLNIYYAK